MQDRPAAPIALALACSLLLVGAALGAGTVNPPIPERPPAVAGKFYPDDEEGLRAAIGAYMRHALPPGSGRPVALVAPHAGYHYSGQIAADAWRQAEEHDYDLIVILGANHAAPAFNGVSVFLGDGYRTPLGLARIDRELATKLADSDKRFAYRPEAHLREHSIEVQVPFAQTLFPEARILTAVVGSQDPSVCARFGKRLAELLEDRRALIVSSSDLSHYPAQPDAITADHATLRALATLDAKKLIETTEEVMARDLPELVTCACGRAPILAGIEAARALGATRGRVISYANSGDVAIGDPHRVVGYAAVAFLSGEGGSDTSALTRPAPPPAETPLTAEEKESLLVYARTTIEHWLQSSTIPLARGFSPTLWRKQGVFVTLKKEGALRGCIGHIEADRPMCQVIGSMALQAAFNDRRFAPVQAGELEQIDIEISLLTPLVRVDSPEEIELGRDGVQLRKSGRSAIYLPEVAVEQGWTREETLEHLCRKAGLLPDAWREGAELYTFRTVIFSEPGAHQPGS